MPRVFCDANVLYSSLLRDLLLRLAKAELVSLHWSAEVQDEWSRHLTATRPDRTTAIVRTRKLMEQHFPDANVTGYEHLTPTLTLPDPDDRHVLAAAIRAGADTLLTFNLRDFPRDAVRAHGLDVLHPDPWLCSLVDAHSAEVGEVLAQLLAALKNPPLSREQLGESLERLGLPGSAARVRELWVA